MLRELIRGFLRPQWIGAASLALGAYNTFANDNGGGGGNSGPTGYSGGSGGSPLYVPTGIPGADTNWQQLLAQLLQTQGQTSAITGPDLLRSYQAGANVDPTRFLAGAQDAGNASGYAGGKATSFGDTLSGRAPMDFNSADALRGAGQQSFLASMDPQKALYDRTLQQIQDQSRASSSAHGVGMGGYGAGVENKAVGDFNIDWQNQQLARMLSGLQGYGQASAGADRTSALGGADLSGAMGFYGQAPGLYMGSGQMPFDANMQVSQIPGQLATQYAGQIGSTQLSPLASFQSSIIPYMNQGIGAGNYAGNLGAQNRQFGANQTAANTQALLAGGAAANTAYNTPGSWLNSFNTPNTNGNNGYYDYSNYGGVGGSTNTDYSAYPAY